MTQQITKTLEVLQELGRTGGRPRAPSARTSHPHPLSELKEGKPHFSSPNNEGVSPNTTFFSNHLESGCMVTVFKITEWSKGGKRPRSDPLRVTSTSYP